MIRFVEKKNNIKNKNIIYKMKNKWIKEHQPKEESK